MAQIVWKQSALDDLQNIVGYYAKVSPVYAQQLMQRLQEAPRFLTDSPKMGRVVPEWGEENVRELIVRPYRLIYVLREDICFIVAIIDARRDVANLLRPSDLDNG